MTAAFILEELTSVGDPEKATFLQRFFKTGPGEYAEGDLFLGIRNPVVRNVAKANKKTPLPELRKLIRSEYHEARFCALLIAMEQYKKATKEQQEEFFDFYMAHTDYINNWDLIDITCPYIVGAWLQDKDRSILYELAQSGNLWKQRIAIVSSVAFIRKREFDDTLALADILLNHPHQLMHKAVGWMLREIGKRDRDILSGYLDSNATKMARTTLRYAIEHYPEDQRQYYLKLK